MQLRKLESKDAFLMLEWMHDKTVVGQLQSDFHSKTLKDCLLFIDSAQDTTFNMHMAVVNENDIYMGTVSLKYIRRGIAEFAITVRKSAMGMGYAKFAMDEIVGIGFGRLGLKTIYWCVSEKNNRAIHFYKKNGYKKINLKEEGLYEEIVESGVYTGLQISKYIWYAIKNDG